MTPNELIERAATYVGVTADNLLNRRRTKVMSWARGAVGVALHRAGYSYPAAAQILRRADHTTVLHMVREHEERMGDPWYAELFAALHAEAPPPRPPKVARPRGLLAKFPDLRERYEAGASIEDLMALTGRSMVSVYKALKAAGATLRGHSALAEKNLRRDCEIKVRFFLTKESMTAIGADYGISRERVRQVLKREGVKLGDWQTPHRREAKERAAEARRQRAEVVAQRRQARAERDAAIVADYRKTGSTTITARNFGISQPVAHGIVARAGANRPRGPHSAQARERMSAAQTARYSRERADVR